MIGPGRRNAGFFSRLLTHGSRPLRLIGVAAVIVVVCSIFLSPVHSLWSKNLLIQGDATTRKVPDRCKDMHFDSYFWGTDGDDTIHGTSGNDMIWGLKGHDSIYGHGGDDCFDGGDDEDRCDDGDGWFDGHKDHSWFDADWGEHESKRNSCDQWGSMFFLTSWWHHSTPTIELMWQETEGALYYNVYRSTEAGGPYESIGSSEEALYSDVGVLEDTWYYYVITAVDDEGFESVPSTETAELVPADTAETPEPEEPSATPEPRAAEPPAPLPDATEAPSPPPLETPVPTESPTPSPVATPTPSVTQEPSPTATPAPTPTPIPTTTPWPGPTDVPTPETPAPTPTPEPVSEPTQAP